MKDLLLTLDGDLALAATGDISITDSIRQAIVIRLRWFLNEWRLGPDFGLPYFEEILIKNPNEARIRQIFLEAILEVDEVSDAEILSFNIDKQNRKARLVFEAVTGEDFIRDEVVFDV